MVAQFNISYAKQKLLQILSYLQYHEHKSFFVFFLGGGGGGGGEGEGFCGEGGGSGPFSFLLQEPKQVH